MSIQHVSGLIAVFEDAVNALRNPGNDFVWSGWKDETEAVSQVEAVITALRSGSVPEGSTMKLLFAPTGPIQEVSVSSGWGEEFLVLASRFDKELALVGSK